MSLQEIEALREKYNRNIILAILTFGIGFFLRFSLLSVFITIAVIAYLLIQNEKNKTTIKRWVVENKISIENLTNLIYLTKNEFYKAQSVFYVKDLIDNNKYSKGVFIDDVIIGKYKNKNIEIVEFKCASDKRNKNKNPSYICMATSNPDKIEGQTVAYSGGGWKFNLPEKIRTESVVFEKIFHTLSTDQIQARLHLKTNVMQDMIDFHSTLQSREVIFYFDASMMYVIFKVLHNPFEVRMDKPIVQSIDDAEIINDLKLVLQIFDDFWLDRKNNVQLV